ncbi:hypothetical protein RND71_018774 [Anisodus tanguticus]|uniref:RING-type domain-containing protein n=1 Tax=Anisodus tanguticus TaxID=243964 RepID=A0AAE1VBA8_9SOLA|nr:hypothetical protein RND71_018774 [Anisodus tanguticus]
MNTLSDSENANVSPIFGVLRFFQSPVSTLLEYSGLFRVLPDNPETESLVADNNNNSVATNEHAESSSSSNGEVSIRIIGADVEDDGSVEERGSGVDASTVPVSADEDAGNNRDSSYQRFDIQQVARWIEQILPFSLLLLFVFIRQHLQGTFLVVCVCFSLSRGLSETTSQPHKYILPSHTCGITLGFFVTIWITAVMFKSNDIIWKQTALKGERKIDVLVGCFVVFVIHVIGIYWWYRNDDLFYPLLMVPPKVIPPFWHAIFIVLVNDTMVRQAAMALKLVLLMYYKNGRGHNFRSNADSGGVHAVVIPGTVTNSCLVKSFFTALKALSKKEVHYGSHATPEQVNAAGDLCAICQEKMHAPILLHCKHIFCEDCVSEWFERERTCPLCRALVRPADLRSFGDGSTSLFFQLF